jgi:DNA-binding SARP family transcriptional activator
MIFELLGPLRVTADDGQLIPIHPPQLRGLLTVLLLNANSPVPAGRLSDSLRETEQRLSGSALRTQIMRLRRALAPASRLHTVQGGYLFEAQPGEIDLDQFRAVSEQGRKALAEGDHETAAKLLSQACELWRAPALPDLPMTTEMTQEADRLLDERRLTTELLTDALLALGHHREVLSDLRARTTADPLNECSCGQFMLALYRSGRKAEAFNAYTRLRKILADEYGVDPGKDLQQLYERILNDDATLPVPRIAADAASLGPSEGGPIWVPHELPPTPPHFSGRSAELATVVELLGSTAGRRVTLPLVVLSGPPGSGKAPLAIRAAYELSRRFDDGQAYVELRSSSGHPRGPSDVLSDLLSALGVPAGRIPYAMDARSRLWRSLTANRSLLIVFDDAAAPDQIPPLLPEPEAAGLLVTSRSRLSGVDATHT